MNFQEMIKDSSITFNYFYDLLSEKELGDWDNINSEDTIKQYCSEMIDKGIHVSHIVEAIETSPSQKELYCIWLGNSMETPTPINTKEDLYLALGLKDLEEE